MRQGSLLTKTSPGSRAGWGFFCGATPTVLKQELENDYYHNRQLSGPGGQPGPDPAGWPGSSDALTVIEDRI